MEDLLKFLVMVLVLVDAKVEQQQLLDLEQVVAVVVDLPVV
jgi:hypothetical protein